MATNEESPTVPPEPSEIIDTRFEFVSTRDVLLFLGLLLLCMIFVSALWILPRQPVDIIDPGSTPELFQPATFPVPAYDPSHLREAEISEPPKAAEPEPASATQSPPPPSPPLSESSEDTGEMIHQPPPAAFPSPSQTP